MISKQAQDLLERMRGGEEVLAIDGHWRLPNGWIVDDAVRELNDGGYLYVQRNEVAHDRLALTLDTHRSNVAAAARRARTLERAELAVELLRRIVSESRTAPPMQLMGVISKWVSDSEAIVKFIDGEQP